MITEFTPYHAILKSFDQLSEQASVTKIWPYTITSNLATYLCNRIIILSANISSDEHWIKELRNAVERQVEEDLRTSM